MVLVKLYYSPTCPKCDEFIEQLGKLSTRIGFDFVTELVNTEFEATYTKDPVSKIYSREWFENFGTEKQKKFYEEAAPFIEMIGQTTIVPALEIRWFYGIGERSIIISGFSEKDADKALNNIVRVIIQLINLERRISSPIKLR